MDTKYLIFSSVTYALRAMNILKRYGFECRLQKIKNIKRLGGCGYALAINSNDVSSAVPHIKAEGLRILDVLDEP